jgi:hypothetical protein
MFFSQQVKKIKTQHANPKKFATTLYKEKQKIWM